MTGVILETIYFQCNVTDAKPVILQLGRFFKGIFPAATYIEARFNGVEDPHVGKKEKRSRKLWKKTGFGVFVSHSDTYTIRLTRIL